MAGNNGTSLLVFTFATASLTAAVVNLLSSAYWWMRDCGVVEGVLDELFCPVVESNVASGSCAGLHDCVACEAFAVADGGCASVTITGFITSDRPAQAVGASEWPFNIFIFNAHRCRAVWRPNRLLCRVCTGCLKRGLQ